MDRGAPAPKVQDAIDHHECEQEAPHNGETTKHQPTEPFMGLYKDRRR